MILSVNIDHIATLRNARNSSYPSLLRAIEIAKNAGAKITTIHLREDRRHIRDADVKEVCNANILPVNFEIAPTEEMFLKAIEIKPKYICFVPEKREELTTEGGLDLHLLEDTLKQFITPLQQNSMEVSLFIEPTKEMALKASTIGVNTIELHTGKFAETEEEAELIKIIEVAKYAKSLGLNVHAGHGLTFSSASKIARIKEISILHIGHFLITESVFMGLENTIKKFCKII
jgi:pyridoxine 5-phosphate synthase